MFGKNENPKSINFLEPINSPSDGWSNTIIWLTKIGKNLLIVVEIVVIGAFVSRFFMDEINNDLADEINTSVTVLENNTWKQSAIKYDNIQQLFVDVNSVKKGQKLNSQIISEILSGIPTTLNVKNLSVNNSKVSINIETSDFKALKEYEEALKNNTYYSDVKFNISKTDAQLKVSVNFSLVEKV